MSGAEPARLWWNDYSLADCAACGDPCVRESPAVLVRGEWAHRCCAKLLDDPEAEQDGLLRCPSCEVSKGSWRAQARTGRRCSVTGRSSWMFGRSRRCWTRGSAVRLGIRWARIGLSGAGC